MPRQRMTAETKRLLAERYAHGDVQAGGVPYVRRPWGQGPRLRACPCRLSSKGKWGCP